MNQGWSIVYLRPDGWWLAGHGFKSRKKATKAASEHPWGHTKWKVMPDLAAFAALCPGACEALTGMGG